MKKYRISNKELHRIGYKSEVSISLVKRIISKYYQNQPKNHVLALLEDILQNQEKYQKNSHFSALIDTLKHTSEFIKPKTEISSIPIPYKIYGKDQIDEGSLIQMNRAMQLPITIKGALMADAHQGYGLPIGGVVATNNAVIPYGVGMDIGCRMCLSVYNIPVSLIDKDAPRLEKILLEETRFGNDEFNVPDEHPVMERKEFKEIKFLRNLQSKAHQQLGTSGHGNHFVDIGELEIFDSKNEWNKPAGKYLAILSHSGSRNMGAEIARHYTRVAKDMCNLPKGFIELSWLYVDSEEGQEYWSAMNLAGDYSAANHEIIHKRLSEALSVKPMFVVQNHHNFAWKEKLDDGTTAIIHRKGATPANKGVLGIIPGSMASPAFVVRGKGNPDSLNSAAHGAGRLQSRKAAKASVSKKEMDEYLLKNKVKLIGGNTDEAPWVYKDIIRIMDEQKELVEILAAFNPRIVRMAK